MSCRVCTSANQNTFPTEIAIHLAGVSTPHVFVFPKVVVCMDCGFTEFVVPEAERLLLTETLGVKKKLLPNAR